MISIIRRIKLKNICIAVFWIFVWEGLYLLVNQPLFLTSPINTFVVLFQILIKGSTWIIIGNTTLKILSGYIIALVIGMAAASLSYVSHTFEEVIRPVMSLIKSIPMASFIVLVLAWLSSAEVSRFITGFVVFPMAYFNFLSAMRRVDHGIIELCRVFHVSILKKIKYVFLPKIIAELPDLLKITVGMGIRAAIAAELIGIPKNSIGEAIYKAKIYFDISDLFAWTIITIILCYVLEEIMIYFSVIIRRAVLNDRSN